MAHDFKNVYILPLMFPLLLPDIFLEDVEGESVVAGEVHIRI